MSSIIGRAALRATPRLRADAEGVRAIRQGAKRDPELYVSTPQCCTKNTISTVYNWLGTMG